MLLSICMCPVPAMAQAPPVVAPAPAVSADPKAGEPAEPALSGQLTVATWGGAYAQALKTAILQPFSARTGMRVVVEHHQGPGHDGDRLKAAIETPPDVLDLSAATLTEACTEGLLETIDRSALKPAAAGPAEVEKDFLEGSLTECGVGSLAWSAVFVFDRSQFKDKVPASIADVFDVARFPGRRALPRSPRFILEAALLADSVPPDEIYPVLETDEGVAHALENLRRLTKDVVWWEQGGEAVRTIRDRQAAVGLAFSGRVFEELAALPQYGIIWDGQIYDMNYWAVAKRSPNKIKAMEFIGFATAPEQLASAARLFPYGPVRASAVPLVGRHAGRDVDLSGFLPTTPRNLQRALHFDAVWWAKNESRLMDRFEAWLKEVARHPG
jgi:putative spermidine/putrescine transport system substrate-binding protein